jgi:hypothetical protein
LQLTGKRGTGYDDGNDAQANDSQDKGSGSNDEALACGDDDNGKRSPPRLDPFSQDTVTDTTDGSNSGSGNDRDTPVIMTTGKDKGNM